MDSNNPVSKALLEWKFKVSERFLVLQRWTLFSHYLRSLRLQVIFTCWPQLGINKSFAMQTQSWNETSQPTYKINFNCELLSKTWPDLQLPACFSIDFAGQRLAVKVANGNDMIVGCCDHCKCVTVLSTWITITWPLGWCDGKFKNWS